MSRRLLIAARSVVPHRHAGYQRMTWDLGAALRSQGWDVTLLTTPVPGRGREFGVDGLHVVTVPTRWTDPDDRSWDRNAPLVARRLGLESCDAVLGVGPAGQVLRPRTPRSVFHCRDTLLHEPIAGEEKPALPFLLPKLRTWGLRRLAQELDYLRRADEVVVPGPAAGDALLRRWPYRAVARRRPRVVPLGVPTRRFRPDPAAGFAWRESKGIPLGVPLVVTVCRLEPGKGLLDAVAAFRAFRHTHRRARYVVVGTGPAHGRLRQRISDLHLGSCVDLLGSLPDLHVVRWLQAADLFLHLPPASDARPPLNVLEAIACGAPVVTTTTALDPERPHPLLVGVPPGKPAQAALAMAHLWREGPPRYRPLRPCWTMEWSARGYDAVLQGRRA